jgi:hypothetical protein
MLLPINGNVALAALPRLQLELTPSPGTPVLQRQQNPLMRLKLKRLHIPSGPLNEPGGRTGDRNPEYRDADEPHSGGRNQQHSGLADDGGLKRDCSRMQDGDHIHRAAGRRDKCLKGSHTST